MHKIIIIVLGLIGTALTAEVSSSYSLLEKHGSFKPDIKTEADEVHAILKKDNKHPVYRNEEPKNEARANIQPVRSTGPVVKHDMLADQPMASTEVNRIDNLAIPGYGFVPGPAEVAYPDIAYAPAYGYDTGYAGSKSYDMYGNGPYALEPDTSPFSLLWSQVPDSRTFVTYVGRSIVWVFNSIFVLLLGSLLTVGVCSYTNLCSITFHGVGPIHEEMRSLMSPEKLEKISHAADFVKNAIDKYQKIQKVAEVTTSRRRRAIFY